MLCAHAASEGGRPGAQRVTSKDAVSALATPPAIFADQTSRNRGAAGSDASRTTYAHVAGSGRSRGVSAAAATTAVPSPAERAAHVACVARSAFATPHAAASAAGATGHADTHADEEHELLLEENDPQPADANAQADGHAAASTAADHHRLTLAIAD